jgi:hypothetical protein
MKLFQELGAELEEAWREKDYDEGIFPALAADALRRYNIPSKLTAWDVIEWTLEQPELPPQKDPAANFGDPPITLFVAPLFYIDVYFWLDGTTDIHQHSFCGAFQVLLGSSIHSWYDFDRSDCVNSFVEIGSLRLKVCELLTVGDVQEIRAVHSLFHLDQPSVTIVVRSEGSPLFLPQFSYYKPSLAADPFFQHQSTTKKIQTIGALIQVDHPDTDRLVTELLERSDFHTTFLILSHLHGALPSQPLGQLFNLDSKTDRFGQFLDVAIKRHGDRGSRFADVFRYRDSLDALVRRRSYVTDPEHRFFFALLLNLDNRDKILSLIKSRFPDADPIEKILDWAYDLANTRVVGVNTPNALGIGDFSDVDLTLLGHLLGGKSDEVAREELAAEYGANKLDGVDVERKLSQIWESVVFKPLLA